MDNSESTTMKSTKQNSSRISTLQDQVSNLSDKVRKSSARIDSWIEAFGGSLQEKESEVPIESIPGEFGSLEMKINSLDSNTTNLIQAVNRFEKMSII